MYVAHGITFYFKGERRFVESEPLNAKHYFTHDLEDTHGIYVSYEKGLIRRRVFVIDRVKKELGDKVR